MRAVERIKKHGWESALDQLVVSAGEATLPFFQNASTQVQHKADSSPVTAADLAAHQIILSGLTRLTSDVPVISEESFDGEEATAARIVQGPASFWLVDPLDGTREFMAGSDEFTVNIALMENGRPVAGWVYLPVKKTLYKAICGHGAQRIEHDAAPVVITTRPFPRESPVILISRSHRRGEAEVLAESMPQATVRMVGSSYKYGLIADGTADLSVRRTPTKLWDTAAADAILTEAGGQIIAWDGQPLDYSRSDLTNPPFMAVGDRQLHALRKFGFLLGIE